MSRSTLVGMLVAIGGVATPFVILWFRHVALQDRVTAHREPTEAERARLRQRGRASVVVFVLFWIVSLGLIAAVALLRGSPVLEQLVLAAILALAMGGITLHLQTRCPICRYRLGFQRSLGIPGRCERCGAVFTP